MASDVVDGGYYLLLIMQKDDIERIQSYVPMDAPCACLLPGECRGVRVAFVKPEDEEKMLELVRIGDGLPIAELVSSGLPLQGDMEPPKLLYRKLSESVQ